MRSHWLFPAIVLAVFAAAAPLSGQSAVVNTLQNKAALLPVAESGEQLPPGTVIPVLLETTLDSLRGKAGQRVVATIGQTISLGERVIRVRSKLLGQVTEVSGDSGRATLAVRFDRLLPRKSNTPLPLDVLLRAVASPMAVADSGRTTTDGIGWNNPPAVWTTVQIGGDVVYRGGGPVANSFGETVGEPVHGGLFTQWSGVLARVSNPAGSACQNLPLSTSPQSVWIFSASACGVYGLGFHGVSYENLASGEILFSAPQRVKIPGGSAFLLTVAGRTPSALAAEQ
jgi:hypothetical protein